MLSSAVPTDIAGKTITITFAGRANYEMMSLPSQQKFVRELLARCLGVDSIQVNYALDINAPPRPPAAPRTKVRRERDLTAVMDGVFADQSSGHVEPVDYFAAPAPASFTAPAAAPPRPSARTEPAQPTPSSAAAVVNNKSDSRPAASAPAHAAALEDPLVQEALSIFGGELMDE